MMKIGFRIRVVDTNGSGVEGAEVVALFPHETDRASTDQDGWVSFERDYAFGDAVRTTLYVDGEIKAENIWIEDEDTLSFTV
jgi:hypothetical protein